MTPPPPQRRSQVAAPGTTSDVNVSLVMRILTLSTFVVILNETIMVNAIPRLMRDFAVPATSAQWLSTAFMLTMAVVIPATGWFLQRVTTRNGLRAGDGPVPHRHRARHAGARPSASCSPPASCRPAAPR